MQKEPLTINKNLPKQEKNSKIQKAKSNKLQNWPEQELNNLSSPFEKIDQLPFKIKPTPSVKLLAIITK